MLITNPQITEQHTQRFWCFGGTWQTKPQKGELGHTNKQMVPNVLSPGYADNNNLISSFKWVFGTFMVIEDIFGCDGVIQII